LGSQKIAPAALIALKRALTGVYWYKNDLRAFLTGALRDPRILSRINWDDYKRDIVARVVDEMVASPDRHRNELIDLMTEVAKVDDFSHLARLDNGAEKVREARDAVNALRKAMEGHEEIIADRRRAAERTAAAQAQATATLEVRQKLDELKLRFVSLVSANLQQRGYDLEALLRELFELFDLDPRASFRVVGEQIDGGFTFDSTDYLFEGKWQRELVAAGDLYDLGGKLAGKLDNTLGLFLSINGYSRDGIAAYARSVRRLLLLMDGSDLLAVLEDRIRLPDLLLRKRRHASQTGEIFFTVADILAGRS